MDHLLKAAALLAILACLVPAAGAQPETGADRAALTAALQDGDPAVRRQAGLGLAMLGEAARPSAGAMREAVRNAPTEEERRALLDFLLGVDPQSRATAELLRETFLRSEGAYRVQIGELLMACGPEWGWVRAELRKKGDGGPLETVAIPAAEAQGGKASPQPESIAAEAPLGEHGSREHLEAPPRIREPDLPDAAAGRRAAEAAAQRGFPEHLENLRRGRGQELGEIYMIGRAGETAAAAVPDLIARLRSDRETVRSAAAWALGRIGERAQAAEEPLAALSRDPSPSVRAHAAAALRAVRSGRAPRPWWAFWRP